MTIPSLQPKVNASEMPIEQLAVNTKVSDKDKLKEVARQFEAVLVRQMLQETRKSVVTPGSQANSSTSGIYDDMINNQLADQISRSGLGLAKSLEGQLTHQVLPNVKQGDVHATPLAAQPGKIPGK